MEKNVKKNLAYNFAYQLLAIVLPLITTPYISRVLGPTRVGEYSYAYAIGYYFILATMLGLNNYGNRTIAMVHDDPEKVSKAFCSIYIMQLLMGILSTIVYILYALFFSNDVMTWIVLMYVASAVVDINWFFFGVEQFKLTVTRNALLKILSTVCIFVFIKTQEDVYLYAIIMVSSIVLNNIILLPFLRRYVHYTKVSASDVVQHIKPNLILFIPILAVSLYKVMDKIMLGILTSKTEVGLYESSERIIQIPMALIQAMGTVMMPKMTNLIANKEENSIKSYYRFSFGLAMLLSSSICFGIMGVARFFVPWFYGDQYMKCVYLFQILLPSCVFLAFANVIRTQYLIPRKKDKIFITSVILGAIVNLVVNYILIPSMESIGAAIGTLIAEITVCVYQVLAVKHEMDILEHAKNSIAFVISGIIMYLVLSTITPPWGNFVNMVVMVALGIVVYGIGVLLLWYIPKRLINKGENKK